MTENKSKPITDKPITVRIPLDLLQEIEDKASDRYPSRKGTRGNRSQVILDALVFYQSHQWGEDDNISSVHNVNNEELIEEAVKKFVSDNVHDVIQNTVHEKIQSITDNLEYLIDKAVENKLQSLQSNTLDDEDLVIQSVQDSISETKNSLQSTQSNKENNLSEDTVEDYSNENQDIDIIEETELIENEVNEESKKKIQEKIEDKAITNGITDKELVSLLDKIGRKVTYKTVNKWRNGKSNPIGKNKNLFNEWEIKGDLWFPKS